MAQLDLDGTQLPVARRAADERFAAVSVNKGKSNDRPVSEIGTYGVRGCESPKTFYVLTGWGMLPKK